MEISIYYKNNVKKIIIILFLLNCDMTCAASVADSWIVFAKSMKDAWNNCSVDLTVFDCLKHSSLEVFDKMVKSDTIPLTPDARLVKHNYHRKMSLDNVWKRNSISTESWTEHVLRKIFFLFETHTLNIDLIPKFIGRARHRNRNQMLPMMTFGVTAAGLFLIPMGFQFLAVLAGKALLLSKMALFLASMHGLKKVASSGVHYGLYHADPHTHWDRGGHWDRGDHEHPRSQS